MSAKLVTNTDKRLLHKTKFPPEFDEKVDMKKVAVDLIKKWITDELATLLNNDDDVVTEMVFNIIDGPKPNIKEMQIQLTGFLGNDAPKFCLDLWKLCLSAQKNAKGVPQALLEAKKAEIAQAKAEEDRAREATERRRQEERDRDRDMERIRERERNERSRGRGGRYGRADRRPPRRDSRSPPPRRRDGDDNYRAPARGLDSYVPGGRGRGNDGPPRRRRRSPSSSRSRSRSPPPRRKRRNTSSEPSRSPPRRRRSIDKKRGDSRERSRSPVRNHRSPGPRSYRPRRRSSSLSDRSRSPPPKRNRRVSPSASPPPRKKRDELAPNDLMSGGRARRTEPRLSRELSDSISPPSRKRKQRNTSSPPSSARDGAERAAPESGFVFKGVAAVYRQQKMLAPLATPPSPATVAEKKGPVVLEKELREKLLSRGPVVKKTR